MINNKSAYVTLIVIIKPPFCCVNIKRRCSLKKQRDTFSCSSMQRKIMHGTCFLSTFFVATREKSFQVWDNRLESRGELRFTPKGEIGKSFSVLCGCLCGWYQSRGLSVSQVCWNVHVATYIAFEMYFKRLCILIRGGEVFQKNQKEPMVVLISLENSLPRSKFLYRHVSLRKMCALKKKYSEILFCE